MTVIGGVALFVVAAAAGTLGRGALAQWANRPGRVGWGTVTANVVASGGLGMLVGAVGDDPYAMAPGMDWVVGAGAIGALGTWSAMATEVAGHLHNHRLGAAALQLGGSLGGGTLAAMAGLGLAAVPT